MPTTVRKSIVAADRAKRKAREWREKAVTATVDAVLACPHPPEVIVEGEYHRGTYSTLPPFFVCRECGYAEEGWGAGLWQLKQTYREHTLPRDEAWKLVRVFVEQSDMERLGRYGKHRADHSFSLRNCTRNV